jgi:hypothetical protein
MKIFRHDDYEQIRFCDRCGGVSDAATRGEAVRAAQLRVLMMSGWRLV